MPPYDPIESVLSLDDHSSSSSSSSTSSSSSSSNDVNANWSANRAAAVAAAAAAVTTTTNTTTNSNIYAPCQQQQLRRWDFTSSSSLPSFDDDDYDDDDDDDDDDDCGCERYGEESRHRNSFQHWDRHYSHDDDDDDDDGDDDIITSAKQQTGTTTMTRPTDDESNQNNMNALSMLSLVLSENKVPDSDCPDPRKEQRRRHPRAARYASLVLRSSSCSSSSSSSSSTSLSTATTMTSSTSTSRSRRHEHNSSSNKSVHFGSIHIRDYGSNSRRRTAVSNDDFDDDCDDRDHVESYEERAPIPVEEFELTRRRRDCIRSSSSCMIEISSTPTSSPKQGQRPSHHHVHPQRLLRRR